MNSLPATIATEIESDQFPALFEEFETVVEARYWKKRVHQIKAEIKGNKRLAPVLESENSLAITLDQLSQYKARHGRFPVPLVQSASQYEACRFVAMFVELHRRASTSGKKDLSRRVQGAIQNNPDDLRAILFEWLVAVHLAKRGFEVEFPELHGTGTLDIRAAKETQVLEVECKSISASKGRKLHPRVAMEILSLFEKDFGGFARGLATGLVARVIVPARLPTRHVDQVELCKQIRGAILSGAHAKSDALDIRLHEFSLSSSPFITKEPDPGDIATFLRTSFSIDNTQTIALYFPGKRAMVLSLESAAKDRLVDYLYDVIKVAEKQLSGSCGGVVCVKLEGLTSDELAELGAEVGTPNALRVLASRFLDSRRTSHIVCVSFFADGGLLQLDHSVVTQEGRSYYFPNPESPFFNDAVVSAFATLD
jgi:hypothetical protein